MLQLTKTEQRRLAHPSKLLEVQTQGQEFKFPQNIFTRK